MGRPTAQLASEAQALSQYLELCEAARAMEEFPWQRLLELGALAGFERNVIVHATSRGETRTLSFYAETIIRSVVEKKGKMPTITIWGEVVTINSEIYRRLDIALSSDWLPMFKAYANATAQRPRQA